MPLSINISVNNGTLKIRDWVNSFELVAPYDAIPTILDALDEVIRMPRNGRLDTSFSLLGSIKAYNAGRRNKTIYANFIKFNRASIIRDELLQVAPEYDISYDNIKDYLLKTLGYKRFIKKNIKEKLYKSSISRLRVMSEKGEKVNEKSSC